MTEQEWKESFTWLVSLYPNWRPDRLTAASWGGELGDAIKNDFIVAVKVIIREKPSDYPPSISTILHKLKTVTGGAFKIGAEVWPEVLAAASSRSAISKDLPEATTLAIAALGGLKKIGMTTNSELPFVRKDFIELFSNFMTTGRTKSIGQIESEVSKKIGNDFAGLVKSIG